MLRVANKAIFILDANNFGQGSWPSRSIKQALNALSLWPLAVLVKSGGEATGCRTEMASPIPIR
jgi:hypothetical protein